MIKDINDYISITPMKNGATKIKTYPGQETNRYELLHEMGYCRNKLDSKWIYYKRENTDLKPVNIFEIKRAFLDFLKTAEFKNIPMDIHPSTLVNWFYETRPIRENELFYDCLSDTLSEDEIHILRMKIKQSYRHNFKIQQMLSKLKEWNFNETVDKIGIFSKDDPLFYKNIGLNKYIVFNQFNSKLKGHGCFDCWEASFRDKNKIGLEEPDSKEMLASDFDPDTDLALIEKFLN